MFRVSFVLLVCQFLINGAFQFNRKNKFRSITYSSPKNLDDDKTSAAEQLRINAILKQQGITIDDVRKLKDAIASGSKYNKREDSPTPSKKLAIADSLSASSSLDIQTKDILGFSSLEKLSTTSPSLTAVSRPVPSTSLSASVDKHGDGQAVGETTATKKITIRPKIKVTKSTDSSHSIIPDRSSNIVSNNNIKREQSSADVIADEFYSNDKNIQNNLSNREGRARSEKVEPVSLTGITLKKIVEDLVEEYGWVYLYEQTNLRCFQTNPTLNSSLKVLRQDNSVWARKKIEYLYVEMRKAFHTKGTK